MTRDEVKELFKFLKYVYPNFEVSSEKVDIWHELMADQDFLRVMKKAKEFAKENRYPPAVADLYTPQTPKNDFLKQYRQWLKEGEKRIEQYKDKGVPEPPWKQLN